jgi:hypothetical protein
MLMARQSPTRLYRVYSYQGNEHVHRYMHFNRMLLLHTGGNVSVYKCMNVKSTLARVSWGNFFVVVCLKNKKNNTVSLDPDIHTSGITFWPSLTLASDILLKKCSTFILGMNYVIWGQLFGENISKIIALTPPHPMAHAMTRTSFSFRALLHMYEHFCL